MTNNLFGIVEKDLFDLQSTEKENYQWGVGQVPWGPGTLNLIWGVGAENLIWGVGDEDGVNLPKPE